MASLNSSFSGRNTRRQLRRVGLMVFCIAMAAAPAAHAYRTALKQAKELYGIGAYAQAIEQYESALADSSLKGSKRSAAERDLQRARQSLAAEKYNLGQRLERNGQVQGALNAYRQALDYDGANPQYQQAFERLDSRFSGARTAAQAALAQARQTGSWEQSLDELQSLSRQGSVPEVQFALNTLKLEATDYFSAQSDAALLRGAYQSALDAMVRAARFSESTEIQNRKLARHHLLLAEQAWDRGRHTVAYEEIQQSLVFEPDNAQIRDYAEKIEGQWLGILYNNALQASAAGDLQTAKEKLQQISRYEPGFLDVDERLAALNQTLTADYYQQAEELMADGRTDAAGLALAYYMVAGQQSPERYPRIRDRIAEAKTRLHTDIETRVSLNVTNSSQEPSAAGVVRDSLLSGLKGSSLKNLQILERDALDDILREQGMGQAFFDPATAVGVKKIKGIQSGIYVDVVRFDVTESGRDRPSYNSKRYVSGTRFVPNPRYSQLQQEIAIAQQNVLNARQDANRAQAEQNRLMSSSQSNPGDRMAAIGALGSILSNTGASMQVRDAEERLEQLQYAFAGEASQLEEDVYSDYRYEVYDLALTGEVLLSYKIVDFATSEVGEARTARARNTIDDRWVPGDPGKGVPADPVELPSQQLFKQELLDGAIESLIAGLEQELGEGKQAYLQRARNAAQDGARTRAIENYIRFLSAGADLLGPEAQEANDYVYEELGIQLIKRRR